MKKLFYALMSMVVIFWALEYVFAKQALNYFSTPQILFFKYLIAIFVVGALKIIKTRKWIFRKKELKLFLIAALVGDIGFFYCEYTAMDYLPVGIITIILALVPVVAMFVEYLIHHRTINIVMAVSACGSFFGVMLVIGADLQAILNGKFIGYLLAICAVFCWNTYSFLTEALHENYDGISLTLYQMISTLCLLSPYMIFHFPKLSEFTPGLIWSLLYLGIVAGGICFTIDVNAIKMIGVTPTTLFSNMLPFATIIVGWIFLGEVITLVQILGGGLVVSSAIVIIFQREKLEKLQNALDNS